MDFGPIYACQWGAGDWRFEMLLLLACGCIGLYWLVLLPLTRRRVALGSKMSFSEPPKAALWNAALAVGVVGERLLSDAWDLYHRLPYSYPPFYPPGWLYTTLFCGLAVGACLAWRRSWPSLAHAAAEPADPRPIRLLL